MLTKNLGWFIGLALVTAACSPRSTVTSSSTMTEKTPVTAASTTSNQFGETITAAGAISYDELLQSLTGKDSLQTKVQATVSAVCQAKGCWMTLVSTTADKPEMMVKFKDYGFFVPKDIAGRQVIMQGVAYREVTPVDELRHYAEDAGKSAAEIAAITQPKEELKFMASGVLLLDNN